MKTCTLIQWTSIALLATSALAILQHDASEAGGARKRHGEALVKRFDFGSIIQDGNTAPPVGAGGLGAPGPCESEIPHNSFASSGRRGFKPWASSRLIPLTQMPRDLPPQQC